MVLNLSKPGSINASNMQRLRSTYSFVFLGLFLCAIGCIIGLPYASSISTPIFIGFVILEFAALFLFMFKKRQSQTQVYEGLLIFYKLLSNPVEQN